MKKIMSALCMLIAVILMALPFGVPMTFAPGPKERVVRYFSYFSMVPVGYGNWFPIITAFLSVIIVLLLLAGMKKVKYGKYSRNFADHMYYITAIVVVAV